MRKISVLMPLLSVLVLSMLASCQGGTSPLNYVGNDCPNYDGYDDYVNAGYSSVFRPPNALMVEAWIKPRYTIQVGSNTDFGREWGMVVSCGSSSGFRFAFQYTTGLLYFWWAGSSYYASDRNKWYNTSWNHIAITYNNTLPSNNVKIYVNGTLDAQHDATLAIPYDTGPLQIGRIGGYVFGGMIDEVRMWNISRARTQIEDTMNRWLDPTECSDPNLVGYWRFDEGSGDTCQDYSIYDHDATLIGPQWAGLGAPIIPEFSAPFFAMIALSAIAVLLSARITRRKLRIFKA